MALKISNKNRKTKPTKPIHTDIEIPKPIYFSLAIIFFISIIIIIT